jgi:hypothetical protein
MLPKSSSSIVDYQSKLSSMRQKFQPRNQPSTTGSGTGTHAAAAHTTGQGAKTGNLNTSFSAMNSSLSQKWNEMSKRSAATKREGTAGAMSSTMGNFGGQPKIGGGMAQPTAIGGGAAKH